MRKIHCVILLYSLFLSPFKLYAALPGYTFLNAALPGFMLKDMGILSGRAVVEGKPVKGAIISFFVKKNGPPPINGGMRRVPEFLTRSDANGKFKIRLYDGEYYVGILLREPDAGSGPPRQGEKYYFAGTAKGTLRTFTIGKKTNSNVGSVYGYSPSLFISNVETFTVKGIVRDEKGDPFPGVVVLGKLQLNIPRPGFISERTGADGAFSLQLPTGKGYYLVARETIAGGRPEPGNYVGTYGIKSTTGLATPSIFSAGSPPPGILAEDTGSRALLISGSKGEVFNGVDIFMYEVPDPEEIKSSIQGTTGAPKFDQGTTLDDILFEPNSSHLDGNAFKELERWVSFLRGKDELDIELAGHSDNLGSNEKKKTISEKRAKAVAEYLISKGISALRIVTIGHGGEHPIASNDSAAGRHKNRRVEIKFISRRYP